MILKVAFMHIICVILGVHQKFSNMCRKIVNTCRDKIKEMTQAGSSAHKACSATNVTQLLSDSITQISTKGSTATAPGATKVKSAHSSIRSRNATTLKKYAKITENKCKIKSTISISTA